MKHASILIVLCFLLSGCNKKTDSPPVVIRVGDSMESVISHFETWDAQEVHLSTYTVYVPVEENDDRNQEEIRAEFIAKNPYGELPPFSLPNGLIVDLHSEGTKLTSISKEIIGETKGDHETIDGFVGLRYDGDWTLLKK